MLRSLFYSIVLFILSIQLQAQTPGFIYKIASTALGRSILDPNGDGYTSNTSLGFTATGTSPKLLESNSELKMIPMPVITEEPLGDPVTGGTGGQTDIVSAGGSESIYLLKRTVNGVDYLMVRFRLGSASTASKGFSLLLETNRVFGSLLSSNNLGFDREIVYETGSNGRIAIYSHTSSGTNLLKSYNVNEFSQRSYASSSVGGKQNVFYDFCVPIKDIEASEFVRLCAVTVSSAGSGITGSISDFNGINDKSYGNNTLKIQEELINGFPELNFDEMDENFDPNVLKVKTLKPSVTAPINNGANSVSGFCAEPDGTDVTVYKNGVSIGTAKVSNGTWTLSGFSPTLVTDQKINATALASGKNRSDTSNTVIVGGGNSINTSVLCYNERPTITTYNHADKTMQLTWDPSKSTNTNSNNVVFEIYNQQGILQLTSSPSGPINITTSSITTYSIKFSSGLATGNYYAIANRGCISNPSNLISLTASGGQNQNVGTVSNPSPPAKPTILAPVYAFSGTQNVRVRNEHSAPVNFLFYVNNQFVARTTTETINAKGTTPDFFDFALTGLKVDDFLTVFAKSKASDSLLSRRDSTVVLTNIQTNPPVVTGIYYPISNNTVKITGTSPSPPGTIINVYKNSARFPNASTTTTVNGYGQWELTTNNQTLNTGDKITATAIAGGKTESILSNEVIVLPAPPAIPVVNGPILAGITNTISGTVPKPSSGTNTINVYIDGVLLGQATLNCTNDPCTWTLNNINPNDLYLDGKITAENTLNGSKASSNEVPATGPDNFLIENAGGGSIPTQTAGVSFNIKTIARDGFANGNNTFTNYNTANLYTSSLGGVSQGVGPSNNFSSGILNSHAITLTKSGTNNLVTVSQNLPSVVGSVNILVVPASPSKLTLITPTSKNNAPSVNFSTQPVVAITDAFGNVITDNVNSNVTLSIEKQNDLTGQSITASIGGTTTGTFNANNPAQYTFSGLSINENGTYILKFMPDKSGITPVYDTIIVSNTKNWYGNVSKDFSNKDNWVSSGSGQTSDIPGEGDNVVFHTTPGNPCHLDIDRTLGSITIASTGNANNAVFNLNGKKLTLQGDLNLSNLGKINADTLTSHLVMAGNKNTAQVFAKDRFVNNSIFRLTINNNNGVEMSGSSNIISINDTLYFTLGTIKTLRSSNYIKFLNDASHRNAKTSSHIDGKCSKVGQKAFVFPIGRGGIYAPCEISAPTLITDEFSADYLPSDHPVNLKKNQNNTYGKSLKLRSVKEHWNINRDNGTSAVNITLYWLDNTFSNIQSTNHLTIAHFDRNTNMWEIPSNDPSILPTVSSTGNSGKVTFPSVNTFSPFTFGETEPVVGLPVELTTFKATCLSEYVKVDWTTASEIRNKAFELHKSENAQDWKLIHTIEGQSDKATETQYTFKDIDKKIGYYRLKDIDEDGIENWSQIIFAACKNEVSEIQVYPNPASEYIKVITPNLDNTTLNILSLEGKILKTLPLISNQTLVSVKDLVNGIYLLEIKNQKQIEHIKFLKK